MQTEDVLFPLGPVDVAGAPSCGVMISVPGQEVQTVWAPDWDTGFAAAAEVLDHDVWTVPPGAGVLCDLVAGREQVMGPVHGIKLARLVGDCADHQGFSAITSDMAGFGLMRAMAEFLPASRAMPPDRTWPVWIEMIRDDETSMLAGAIGRDATGAHVYLTQNPDTLRALMETSFGSEIPPDVVYTVARLDEATGQGNSVATWTDGIGAATDMLFDVPFRPTIRTRAASGEAVPPDDFTVRAMTLALFRASGIAQGSDVVNGKISLHDGSFQVEMARFDL